MTHTVTSEIFKWSALWCILCQSRRACAVLWKGLVLLGTHSVTPWRMCDTGNMCRYYFKKEKDSRQHPSFVPNPFPCITPSRTLPPMELFLEWGRHHLSHYAGFEWCKTQAGSHTPCDSLAGDKTSPGERCQLFSSLPIPALLLLLSLPTGVCCFSATAKQGSTIIFTFWIWQGFI